jgi:hypothetical protein
MPYGISGIFTGVAMVFFAYLGFDAVASAQLKRPKTLEELFQ